MTLFMDTFDETQTPQPQIPSITPGIKKQIFLDQGFQCGKANYQLGEKL